MVAAGVVLKAREVVVICVGVRRESLCRVWRAMDMLFVGGAGYGSRESSTSGWKCLGLYVGLRGEMMGAQMEKG